MAEELEMKDLQMKGLTEKITGLLAGMDKSKRKELDLQDIKQRLKEFQGAYEAANIELRHLGPNNPSKNEYKQILKDHKHTLKELRNEFDYKSAAVTKNELLGEDKDTADRETAEGLMKHGDNVMNSSKDSLERTLRTVQDAKEVGVDINAKLEANTAQIEGMYDKLEEIESTLQRSTKVIKRMARKMATDKYVWVVVALVFFAILFIIIYQKVKSKTSSSSSSDTTSTGSGNSFGGSNLNVNNYNELNYLRRRLAP
jgi:DNA repair ATPase RecN